MKRYLTMLVCLLVHFSSLAQNKGFAVAELFTSEGCSSCPPADKLAAATLKEYEGRNVYILAYHVDYWNRLGWKDVYSSHDWSTRQQNYAAQLGLESVYTPQIIVNGRTEFTGSDSRKLHTAINTALDGVAENSVTLSSSTQGNSIDVRYVVTGNIQGKQILIALVQKSASSNVKAGENAGATLKHVNVVRVLKTVPLTSSAGHVHIDIPAGLSAGECGTISFIQSTGGNITGAAALAKI